MESDVAIVGAGAAGLATAIFAARRGARVVLVDSAKKLGAKILVSGGGRCNVTNAAVTPADFQGGSRHAIRRVLDAFPVGDTVAFFREIGVPLHEEPRGKLFPDTNSARTVLDALLREATRLGVRIVPGLKVRSVSRGFEFEGIRARKLVLATGGLSLPKTGSDGTGYGIAQSLGHSIVPTSPALVPLALDGDFHVPLAGISHEAELACGDVRMRGPMLWTHFGISGPVAMDISRVWIRTREPLFLKFGLVEASPKSHVRQALDLPAKVADAFLAKLGIDTTMAHLTREDRRRLEEEWPLPVKEDRGYTFAEVTAGGVPLSEVNPSTLESRTCPGLFLVGEILDVDGRIGGFNFQWAWSSGFVAAQTESPDA